MDEAQASSDFQPDTPDTSSDAATATQKLKQELDALFAAQAEPSAGRRDYVGETVAAVQTFADKLAAEAAPHLPPELATWAQENALLLLLVIIACLAAIVIGLVLSLRRPQKRAALLICGPEGSGKTTMFYQLRQTPLTKGSVTTMVPNAEALCIQHSKGQTKPTPVVDLPGHPRLRSLFEQHSPEAKGVVFVIDASEYVKQKADIAGQMYDVLVNLAASKARVPLLLACNKSDLGSRAFSTSFIATSLEKDIRNLRESRLAGVGQDAGGRNDLLARPGDTFLFAGCPFHITTCSVSALEGSLEGVREFARSLD